MPRYLYSGDAPCRVGTANVHPGEEVESSFCPGKRFTRIKEAEELHLLGILERLKAPAPPEIRELTDFTILSTGLLHEADFSTLSYYSRIGPVVIQYWSDQDEGKIPLDLPGLTLVKVDPPKLPASITRDDLIRFSYQVIGIFLGLEKCTTPYTIRVRNDEHVTDLSALIELFLRDTRKIVSSSIFWGAPLQVGDHIFVAETDIPEVTAGAACTVYGIIDEVHPESELLVANSAKDTEMVLDRADIVHISRLGDYVVVNHPEPSVPGGGMRKWTPDNPCDYKMLSTSHELSDTPIAPYTHSD